METEKAVETKKTTSKKVVKTEKKETPSVAPAYTVYAEICGSDVTSDHRSITLTGMAQITDGRTILRDDTLQLGRIFREIGSVKMYYQRDGKSVIFCTAKISNDGKTWNAEIGATKKRPAEFKRTTTRTGKDKTRIDAGPDLLILATAVLNELKLVDGQSRKANTKKAEEVERALREKEAQIAALTKQLKKKGMSDEEIAALIGK